MVSADEMFWNRTAAEKAAMSEGEVRVACRVALMEAGVVDPGELKLLPEELPPLDEHDVFAIQYGADYYQRELPVVFATAEAAAAFLRLQPMLLETDYRLGERSASTLPLVNASVKPRKSATQSSVLAQKGELERAAANRSANEKARREHAEMKKKADKAVEGIWEEYRKAQERAHHLGRIRETFEEYLRLAGGDFTVAHNFLMKAYPPDDVAEAVPSVPAPAQVLPATPEEQPIPARPAEPAPAPTGEIPF